MALCYIGPITSVIKHLTAKEMSGLFSSTSSVEEETWSDDEEEIVEVVFDPVKHILLKYGTESICIDISTPTYRNKTLKYLASAFASQLGFARNPDDLHYKCDGEYVVKEQAPVLGKEYTLSATRDKKGN